MKGSKMLKRITSVICAITVVVSSITAWNVKADSTSVIILKTSESRATLIAEAQDAEINFALRKDVSASEVTGGNSGGTDTTVITKGAFATARNATTTVTVGQKISEDKWVQIDLGAAYDSTKIDRVAVQYWSLNTSARAGYSILYSLNGVDYVEVANTPAYTSASGNPIICLDKILLSEEQAQAIPFTRFVKLIAKSDNNNTNNGLQVMDMAVLTDGNTKVSEVTSKEIERLDDPASLTVTSSDYGQLEYEFEASEKDDGTYTYYAYINGKKKEEAVLPATKYVEKGMEGNVTVKIIAIKDEITSLGISETVKVLDPKELMTTDRNIAIGCSATSTSTREDKVNGVPTPDDITKLTDGNQKTYFRTLQTDSEASIVIDLGTDIKVGIIEMIAMTYIDSRYAKEYSVEYSNNGEDYVEVCSATGSSELQYSKIYPTEYSESTVRYIMVNLKKPYANGFGFQIYEMAIITKDKSINDAEVALNQDEYVYTGNEITPDVTVTYAGRELVEGEDYIIKCENNINVGNSTCTIEGVGSFADSEELNFKIVEADIEDATVNTSFDENGEIQVAVIYNEKELVNEIDYSYITGKNDDGDMLITITPLNSNFKGTKTKVVAITEFPVSEAGNVNVTSSEANVINIEIENPNTFAGEYQLYDVYIDDEKVEENVNAGSFKYENQNAGTHNIKVVAKLNGNVSTGLTKEITISGKDITKCEINIEVPEENEGFVYTGTEITPSYKVVVKETGDELEKDKHYKVSIENNVNVGEATIKITGIGLYEGELEAGFKIIPKDIQESDVDFSKVKSTYVYTGQEIVPEISVKGLEKNKDYKISIKNNLKPGTASITVEGIGNYKGTVSKEFKIEEAPTTQPTTQPLTKEQVKDLNKTQVYKISKKLSAKKVKITFKKVTNAKKYLIQISTSKKFKKVLVKKVVKSVKATVTSSKLKNKKKLYVRVKAIGANKWSNIRKVTIKK